MIPFYHAGVAFQFCEVGQDADNTAFVQSAHPAGKFPILVDGENVVVEASAIAEYLAASCADFAFLLPGDPVQAARIRMLDRIFDNYVMNEATRVVLAYIRDMESPDQTEIAAARASLRRSYDWLEQELADHGPMQHLTLASCAAAPSLFYADWIEEIGAERPLLCALRAQLLALPAVKRCVDDARPFRSWFPPGAPDRD